MSGKKRVILIIILSSILLVLTNVPLLYGLFHHVPGRKFMGIVAGVRDSNFYFMMMEQARGWRLLLQNRFAPGEAGTIYHGFFWAILGNLAHLLGISNLAAYHGARAAATLLFVPVAWYFAGRFLKTAAERTAGVLMICFGAGAGWIQMIRYYRTGIMSFVPADIGTPEASPFFTLLSFPHLAFALILIALVFALVQESLAGNRARFAVLAGVCGLALGFIHVVNLVVIFAVLGVFAAVSLALKRTGRPLQMTVLFAALSVWPVAYYAYLSLAHPDLLPQAPVRSSGLRTYLAGFAPFLVLSAPYGRTLARKRELPADDLLLMCWAVVNFFMLYSYPLVSQEARTVLGLQLPLAVLASKGIFRTVLPALRLGMPGEKPGQKWAGILVAGLIVTFTFPSTFCNIIERVSRLKAHPEAFSLTVDEYDALQFLRGAPGEGVVLSGDVIGNYVPGMTGKRSWLGQYDLPSHGSRLKSAKLFFAKATPNRERESFLENAAIEYVYYGWEERAMGGFDPDGAPYLERVFGNRSVVVYRLNQNASVEKRRHT